MVPTTPSIRSGNGARGEDAACLKLMGLRSYRRSPEAPDAGRTGAAGGRCKKTHPLEEAVEMTPVDPVEGIAEREAPLCTQGVFRGRQSFSPVAVVTASR